MFWHLYKTRIKVLLKNKTILLWTLLFPFILGTLFYLAFSSITEKSEGLNNIPVAITTDKTSKMDIKELKKSETQKYFFEMIDSLEEEGYISPKTMSFKKGKDALKAEKVTGIITIHDTDGKLSLIVAESGMDQTILKEILDTYKRNAAIITDIATRSPEKVEATIKSLFSDTSFRHEKPLGGKNTDMFAQYFFALLAMTCMYGAYFGLGNTKHIQADQSMVGARRGVSPTKKLLAVLSDFAGALTIEMGIYTLVILYLTKVLGINLGDNWGAIFLTGLCSNMLGVSLGYFVGVAFKTNQKNKISITNAFVLLSCFLAGLMLGNMKYYVEEHLPILNRINPAALISDSFQYICVFENPQRYTTCIVSILVWTLVLFTGSILILRREKYADL